MPSSCVVPGALCARQFPPYADPLVRWHCRTLTGNPTKATAPGQELLAHSPRGWLESWSGEHPAEHPAIQLVTHLTIYLSTLGRLSRHRYRYLFQERLSTGPSTLETTFMLEDFEGESLSL